MKTKLPTLNVSLVLLFLCIIGGEMIVNSKKGAGLERPGPGVGGPTGTRTPDQEIMSLLL